MALRGRQAARWRWVRDYVVPHGRCQDWRADMDEVRVFYDQHGGTLTVWFGDPQQERVCEETADEVVLMKDGEGKVIGFEKLNFVVPEPDRLHVTFEAVAS